MKEIYKSAKMSN